MDNLNKVTSDFEATSKTKIFLKRNNYNFQSSNAHNHQIVLNNTNQQHGGYLDKSVISSSSAASSSLPEYDLNEFELTNDQKIMSNENKENFK